MWYRTLGKRVAVFEQMYHLNVKQMSAEEWLQLALNCEQIRQ